MLAPDGFLKSPIKLIGAKTGHKKVSGRSLIYKYLPKDVTHYVEPFGGSFGVLIGNPNPYEKEWIGDLLPEVCNLFQTIQSHKEELWEYIENMVWYITNHHMDGNQPYYKYFHHIRDSVPDDRILAALRYYIVNKTCMNGIYRMNAKGKCNSSWCKTYKGRGYLTREWYDKVYERIKNVHMFNTSYQNTIYLIKEPKDTVIMIDAPYHDVFTSYNKVVFKESDHIELEQTLKDSKCKWLQTINDTPFIRLLYKNYNIKEVDIDYSCSQSAKGRGPAAELIITNY